MRCSKSILEALINDVYLSEFGESDTDSFLLTLELVDGSYVSVKIPIPVYDYLDSYEFYWVDNGLTDEELSVILEEEEKMEVYYGDESDLPF